jgi:tryptophan halogenase
MKKSLLNSKVIVLGGGSAGWLTALFVQRNWPRCEVTVVEDPSKPPIIAGESGSTTFVTFLKHLKIDHDEFVKRVNATPKLGGKFTDWNGVGTEFIHALQTDYAPWLDGWTDYFAGAMPEATLTLGQMNSIMQAEKNKDTFLKTILGNKIPLSKAFYSSEFINQQRVPFGCDENLQKLPCPPMWHFESRAGAAYFKELGLERGIRLVEGTFQTADLNERGDITAIHLDGDRVETADWFFDCSGFARLLLGKTLNEPLVDMTDYFPARAVVAWWESDPCYAVTTNATAMKYGWSWNINLRHRSGNGYIYDPDHITLDQAVQEAEERFNKKITPIANFQFTPGMMKNIWKNNVFAVGLSGGFLEPLEANGIALIVENLYAIQDYWDPYRPDLQSPETVQRMNDRMWFLMEDFRDFLALHYRGKRRDTEFWRSHGEDKFRIPPSLQFKLDEWHDYFRCTIPEPWPKAYSATAWMMVLQALDVVDTSKMAEVYNNLLPVGRDVLNINNSKYKELVEPFLSIEEWIQRTA